MLLTCGLPWAACAGVLSAVTDHREGGPCSIFTKSPMDFGTGAGRAHPPVPHGAPLVFAGASPHPRLLAAVQRPLQAWGTRRARGAYLLGLADLEQRRAGVPDRENSSGSMSRHAA